MDRQNLFSININEKNVIDNEAFVLRHESAELSAQRDKLNEEFSKVFHKTIKKAILRMLPAFSCCALGLILGSVAFETFQNKEVFPIVIGIVAGMLFVAGVVYGVINRNKQKANENKPDEAMEALDKKYEAFNTTVKSELGIPENAPQIDILTYRYSNNDQENRSLIDMDTANVFVEDGKLCFWFGKAVIGFPTDAIEALVKVNAPITFVGWMSDDPHDSPKYAQYSIEKKEVDYAEYYTMNGYYSLRFAHEDEPFELLFPLFDADALLGLLNREIVEE